MVSSMCVMHSTSFLTCALWYFLVFYVYKCTTDTRGDRDQEFDVDDVDAGAGVTAGAGPYVSGEVAGAGGGVTDVGDCAVRLLFGF